MSIQESAVQLTISPDDDRLSQFSTLQLAPPRVVNCRRNVVLDLTRVRFIEPFGLVFLFWLIQDLINRGATRIDVVSPASFDVRNYMIRMHFPDCITAHITNPHHPVALDQDLSVRTVREQELSDRLLEMTHFHLANDDEVRALTGQIMETVLSRARDIAIVKELRLGLVELLSNVEVHSESRRGVVAVQRYASGVQIAIGDGGIGIPMALRSVVGDHPDDEMIFRALQPQISSRPGRGGLGLATLVDAVRENGGTLGIRSGTAHVQVSRQGAGASECTAIAGTQVEIIWEL